MNGKLLHCIGLDRATLPAHREDGDLQSAPPVQSQGVRCGRLLITNGYKPGLFNARVPDRPAVGRS